MMMMANPSRAHHQEQEAAQPSSYDASAPSSTFNCKNSVSSALNNSLATQPTPALYHNPEISSDWTAEEQLILEEGLFKYLSESNINRYAKIALHLQNKTVRDVALRCRWMVKKEMNKRRKEDNNSVRKNKERKEKKNSYPAASSSHFAAPPSFQSQAPGMVTNDFDDGFLFTAIGGVMGQLIQQNAQAFKQISANLAVHKVVENVGLFCQARANILKILDKFRNEPETMKNMPPLPVRMNEGLANSILHHTRRKS